MRWEGSLATVGPLLWQGPRPWNAAVRRSGNRPAGRQAVTVTPAEAGPGCGGRHHEEVEAQEGQVGHRNLNQWRRRRSISPWTKALKAAKGVARVNLGIRCTRPRLSPPRTGTGQAEGETSREQAGGDEPSGPRRRKTPEARNPTSATCLKMVGRWREEYAAERLGKPESGTVVGWVGPAG